MKYLKTRLLLCSFACCHLISAHVDEAQVMPITQLTQEDISAFYEGEGTPIVLEFTEGLGIPVNFFLGGDLIQLQGTGDWTINIQRTFYLKHVESGFLFSFDRDQWQPLGAFITGCITAELNVRDGYPRFILGAEVNARSSD